MKKNIQLKMATLVFMGYIDISMYLAFISGQVTDREAFEEAARVYGIQRLKTQPNHPY